MTRSSGNNSSGDSGNLARRIDQLAARVCAAQEQQLARAEQTMTLEERNAQSRQHLADVLLEAAGGVRDIAGEEAYLASLPLIKREERIQQGLTVLRQMLQAKLGRGDIPSSPSLQHVTLQQVAAAARARVAMLAMSEPERLVWQAEYERARAEHEAQRQRGEDYGTPANS